MNQPNQILRAAAAADMPVPGRKKCLSAWLMLALLLALGAVRADAQDDDYAAIYAIIAQADALSASNLTSQAHGKYIEAQGALAALQQSHPDWNTKVVSYRLKYLAQKIADTTAAAGTNSTTITTTTATTEVAAVPKSPVNLLAAGSEPRTVLRLHPGVGDKQTVHMTMKMAMAMSAAGKAIPAVSIPAMLMTMEVEVKDVSTAGDITYEMNFTDASVAADTNTAPAMAAALKSSLAGLRGMTGTGRMSSRGISKGVEMKMPAGADPQMSQTMNQMKESFSSSATPLPEEAVGPGARWEYKTRVKSQGMTIDQTATYELVSIEGNRLALHSTITQNAANQKIENPAMPGLKVDLNKMTGTGTGDSTFDLGHIMPVSGAIDENAEIVMGMNVGQQKQTMTMTMTMNIVIEAK